MNTEIEGPFFMIVLPAILTYTVEAEGVVFGKPGTYIPHESIMKLACDLKLTLIGKNRWVVKDAVNYLNKLAVTGAIKRVVISPGHEKWVFNGIKEGSNGTV